MVNRRIIFLSGVSGVAVAATMFAGVAAADPVGAPSPRPLVGVGSDVTQDVTNAFANDITIGGVKQIGSFNATGTTTFDTGRAGCSAVNRPNGSNAGLSSLLNSLNAGDNCIQFARSTTDGSGTAASPRVDYVPFAIDGVTFAITATSTLPRNLTLAQLQNIYTCGSLEGGTGDGVNPSSYKFTPILPQSGAGTRTFWEQKMNITDADVNAGKYPCIYNGVKNGQAIQQDSGTLLDDKSIEPYSIPGYDSQETGISSDRRGPGVLGTIGGVAPISLNTSFPITREVFNVIPDSQKATDPYATVFSGSTSLVCKDTSDITNYGFALDPNCGTLKPTP